MKSNNHLFHDRVSKGHGSSPGFTSQTSLCMHVYKGSLRCKSVCDVKPGLDPCPLLSRSWNRWWLDFITFIAYKKVKIKFKTAKCVSNRCKDLFKQKICFGFRCTLMWKKEFPEICLNCFTLHSPFTYHTAVTWDRFVFHSFGHS